MESGKGVTKTKVDYFLELVNKEKEIALKDAAEKIGVSFEIAGVWADTLEEKGKLTVEYKVATPYVISNDRMKELEKDKDIKKDKKTKTPKPEENVDVQPKKLSFIEGLFKKQSKIEKLKENFITADNKIRDRTLQEKYKRLIKLLIYNYDIIKTRNFQALAMNYKEVYNLITPDLANYLATEKEAFVKKEVWGLYTLVKIYNDVRNLRFIDKFNTKELEIKLNKIKNIKKSLKKNKGYKNLLDFVDETIKKEVRHGK